MTDTSVADLLGNLNQETTQALIHDQLDLKSSEVVADLRGTGDKTLTDLWDELASTLAVSDSASHTTLASIDGGIGGASAAAAGDTGASTIYTTILHLSNSAITAQDLETSLNGTPVSGVWLAGVSIVGFLGKVQLSVWNDGTGDAPAYVDTSQGDTLLLSLDYATGAVTLKIGSNTYAPATLNLGDIPAGQGLRLWAGVISTAAAVVFDAGHISG